MIIDLIPMANRCITVADGVTVDKESFYAMFGEAKTYDDLIKLDGERGYRSFFERLRDEGILRQ